MSKCKSCGAEIKWIKTFSGRSMPVDTEEIHFYADGGKDIFVCCNGAVIHGTRTDGQKPETYTGYISHFATCPNADQHRKRNHE